MKFEDLFKYYMSGDNPEDNIYNPDGDPDDEELDPEDEDGGDSGDGSSVDSEESYDDYQDYDENGEGSGEEGSGEDGETNYAVGEDGEDDQEDQDQDDSNNRNNRDKKDKDEDDTGKEKDTNPTDENGEDGTKTEAGKDQENLDNVDKNLDEKDTENKLKEAKEQEADGSKGHTSSDTGAKNPLEETDAGGLGNEGPQGAGDSPKGAGDSPKGGAGDSPTGGPKGGAGDSPAGGPKGGGAGAEQAGKEVGKEAGKGVADASAKAGGEVAKDAAVAEGTKDAAIGGSTAAAGTGTAAAAGGGTAAAAGGGGAAASGAGGGGLISLIGATVPWSLIVIAVIVIIIIIIIIISFFQTLPGSMLENLKTSVKKWFSNFFAEVAESLGFSDNSLRVNGDDVNRLAQYINDMGYDIQTYGFGDIIVKSEDKGKEGQRDDRAANGVDKKVEDDGESEEIKCKSKYLKAYLAADECTYHFRSFNILNTLFSSSTAQLGLIEVKDDGGFINQYRDKLKIDRTNEDLIVYNHSLDIPVIGWFKKLFTGQRAFQWGEMFRYDLNTWIGRYKRPVELFLAIHLSTMMPDLTYRIATEQRFNTEVDVRFEPIRLCIKGNLNDDTAYIMVNGERLSAKQIMIDYLGCFECKRGFFESSSTFADDDPEWQTWSLNASTDDLWDVFTKLFEKFHDVETPLNEFWNWLVDWKDIKLDESSQTLMETVTAAGVDAFAADREIWIGSGNRFYDYFNTYHTTLATNNYTTTSREDFDVDDVQDMIDKWNEDHGSDDQIDVDIEDDYNDPYVSHKDEYYHLRLKDDSDETKEKVTLAYILYKLGTEDIMFEDDGWGEGDQGGIDNMLWPFVEQVKNHWYYKDIDFLGTTEANATYRLAKVGYKTVEYKNTVDGKQYSMEIPSALYPNSEKDWDFIVYQVAEPVTEGCNDAIKDVFSGQYYRYDGTVEKAMAIANSRALEEGKSTYYYGGTDYTVEDKEKSKAVKEVVSMPDSPEQTLQSLAILKNMHSVSSDYIYRDLKELYVKLEYYSKEQMTEDLTLMWLWPIKVDNKNASFDLVETHDKFGKSIVAYQNAEVLAPCDGTLAKEDDSYEITVTTLNDEAEKLLQYIFRNDYYRINKTKLNGLKIRLDGLTLNSDVHVGDKLKRGQTIGKVNNAAGKLNVTIRFADKTVVDDMTEYMREDHNNKYEEIMKRKMECEEGSLPPVPLRSIFGYSDGGSGVDTSISGYSKNPETVSASANAKAIYQGLKNNFSAEQLAGALGNLGFESGGLYTNNLQNTYETAFGETDESYTNKVNAGTWVSPGGKDFIHDSAGYGLAQWTYYSRKESLYNKHINYGKGIDDIGIQVELLREEMSGSWSNPSWKPAFDSCGSGEDGVMIATKAYCHGYECPEDPEGSMQARINRALGYYQLILAGDLDS